MKKDKIFLSFFDKSVKDKLRQKFYDMKDRCYNPNNKNYALYGANGITICKEWMQDINKFLVWSLKNGYSEFTNSIDRINNTKGYSPKNCRYVNLTFQNNNKYGVHLEEIIINNKPIKRSLRQWSLYFQISYNRMKYLCKKKQTGGKGLKGQQIIEFLKNNKEGIYSK